MATSFMISFRVPTDVAEKIDAIAHDLGYATRSEYVRDLVVRYGDDYLEENPDTLHRYLMWQMSQAENKVKELELERERQAARLAELNSRKEVDEQVSS